jgi:hypothetical protein
LLNSPGNIEDVALPVNSLPKASNSLRGIPLQYSQVAGKIPYKWKVNGKIIAINGGF